jgi:Ni2+-binding GTPase involved in maturation of urease and hydrogenase
MQIIFVSGFLGSGKTTTIINASKVLMKQGLKVGVVTNDQGKYLVDSHFVKAAGIPSVEVSNGCFCCNYDDFDSHILVLAENEKPDIIFAESVGSCADIIASVIKPFLDFRKKYTKHSCLSALADARMLQARLSDKALPFSKDVTYIFDKQIEEADILVINKSDLLTDEEGAELLASAGRRFPNKKILLQSAFSYDNLSNWILSIENLPLFKYSEPSIFMDYEKYSDGELKMAWFDKVFNLASKEKDLIEAVTSLLANISILLKEAEYPVGHLKLFLEAEDSWSYKISLTAMDEAAIPWNLPESLGRKVNIVLNARVETEPIYLKKIIHDALSRMIKDFNLEFESIDESSFKPGRPDPVHRIG